MATIFTSKYYNDLTFFLNNGWTEDEINTYFPILESLSEEDLLQLHKACNIKMFSPGQAVDIEQAIHALVNPRDTPKDKLIDSLKNI